MKRIHSRYRRPISNRISPSHACNGRNGKPNGKTNGQHTDVATYHPLKALRILRNISEQALANRMNISRTRLRQLESKSYKKLSYEQLVKFAKAFHLTEGGFMDYLSQFGKGSWKNFDLKAKGVKMDFGEGMQLSSMVEAGQENFVGELTLPAKTRLNPSGRFKANAIVYFVLEGKLRIQTLMDEKTLTTKQGCRLRGQAEHELFNLEENQRCQVLVASF